MYNWYVSVYFNLKVTPFFLFLCNLFTGQTYRFFKTVSILPILSFSDPCMSYKFVVRSRDSGSTLSCFGHEHCIDGVCFHQEVHSAWLSLLCVLLAAMYRSIKKCNLVIVKLHDFFIKYLTGIPYKDELIYYLAER